MCCQSASADGEATIGTSAVFDFAAPRPTLISAALIDQLPEAANYCCVQKVKERLCHHSSLCSRIVCSIAIVVAKAPIWRTRNDTIDAVRRQLSQFRAHVADEDANAQRSTLSATASSLCSPTVIGRILLSEDRAGRPSDPSPCRSRPFRGSSLARGIATSLASPSRGWELPMARHPTSTNRSG